MEANESVQSLSLKIVHVKKYQTTIAILSKKNLVLS